VFLSKFLNWSFQRSFLKERKHLENRVRARVIGETILTLFGYVEYFSDFRLGIERNYGIYIVVFVDAIVLTATFFAVIFNLKSLFERKI